MILSTTVYSSFSVLKIILLPFSFSNTDLSMWSLLFNMILQSRIQNRILLYLKNTSLLHLTSIVLVEYIYISPAIDVVSSGITNLRQPLFISTSIVPIIRTPYSSGSFLPGSFVCENAYLSNIFTSSVLATLPALHFFNALPSMP